MSKKKLQQDYRHIGVVGHFTENADGQTVKTNILVSALNTELGAGSIVKIDTHGGVKALPNVLLLLLKNFSRCKALIMLPAQNGVKVFSPIFVILGKLFGRKIHYVVIGGWLPEMTKRKKWLAYFLKKFDGIYVETSSMKNALETQGFKSVFIMPNFKDLQILQEKDLVYTTKEPFAFCTFSRVMKEKGIEDAVTAIICLNKTAGKTVATLDIYGKIDNGYEEHFAELKLSFPSYIRYKGVFPPNKSVEILKNYFALLFPTYYEGEGFAGTLLDALSAGVPVIASDWKYNKEIVRDNKTGVLIKNSLLDEIKKAVGCPARFNAFKLQCLQEAKKYSPKIAIIPIVNKLSEILEREKINK